LRCLPWIMAVIYIWIMVVVILCIMAIIGGFRRLEKHNLGLYKKSLEGKCGFLSKSKTPPD